MHGLCPRMSPLPLGRGRNNAQTTTTQASGGGRRPFRYGRRKEEEQTPTYRAGGREESPKGGDDLKSRYIAAQSVRCPPYQFSIVCSFAPHSRMDGSTIRKRAVQNRAPSVLSDRPMIVLVLCPSKMVCWVVLRGVAVRFRIYSGFLDLYLWLFLFAFFCTLGRFLRVLGGLSWIAFPIIFHSAPSSSEEEEAAKNDGLRPMGRG